MPRSGPITLSLPAFSGVTRKLILANVAVFFALGLLHWLAPTIEFFLEAHLLLEPRAVVHGEIWQLVTYSFVNPTILGILFGMLTLWFTGALLEPSFGGRWLSELYFTSVTGGAILASAISFTHVFGLRPDIAATGAFTGIFGLLVAIGMLFGDQEFLFWSSFASRPSTWWRSTSSSPLPCCSKKQTASARSSSSPAPSVGISSLDLRRAVVLPSVSPSAILECATPTIAGNVAAPARKFEVYMRKQNREVHFDKDGRYVDPDELRKNPNDKRWMN